jgi:hypothetical protein
VPDLRAVARALGRRQSAAGMNERNIMIVFN